MSQVFLIRSIDGDTVPKPWVVGVSGGRAGKKIKTLLT